MALLGPGTFFGEEEVLLHIPRATKAVVVSSQAEVYKCPNEVFFSIVNQFFIKFFFFSFIT